MCELCLDPAGSAETPRHLRRKLWEIEGRYHCTVIGTCLSMRDLWKIARKTKMRFPDTMSDYDLHGSVVGAAARKEPLGKLIHRALDRKHRAPIEACKKLGSLDELNAYWTASLQAGDVPGPLWAVLSHPLVNGDLRERLFGDVHMLSHLVGASNRADIQRLSQFEQDLEVLSDDLDAEKARARQAIEERDKDIEALKIELAGQTGQVRRAAMLQSRLERFESSETVRTMSERIRGLTDGQRRAAKESEAARNNLAALNRECSALRKEAGLLTDELCAVRAERDGLERVLEQGLGELCHHCEKGDSKPSDGDIDLGGARVVYVGGRTSHIGHIRTIVEQAGGQFLHHDGGLEDADSRLDSILGRGDVVMCPVDCVSHSACLRAKKFCKHAGKTFVPLRSSGLSSFAAGLREMAAQPGQASGHDPLTQ